VFFIAAGIYVVGGIVFCLLTSGSVQPWASDNRTSSMELVAKSTTEPAVVADHNESVDCRQKSQLNSELPNVGQESLYMQMLSPYFELERTAGKKKFADHGPLCRPKSQSNGELPNADQENLYMQMLSPYFELERTAGKESANQDRVCRPKPLSIGELPIVGQESLYVQMTAPYFELERMAGKKKYADHSHVMQTPVAVEPRTADC